MGKYMRRRLLQVIPVLLIVTVVVFFMVHLSGDPTSMMLPQDATQEARENLREALGLNRPLHVQYWIFIKGLASPTSTTRRRCPLCWRGFPPHWSFVPSQSCCP